MIAYSYRKKSAIFLHMRNEFPLNASIKVKITSVGGFSAVEFAQHDVQRNFGCTHKQKYIQKGTNLVPCRKNNGRQYVKIPQMNAIVKEQQQKKLCLKIDKPQKLWVSNNSKDY